MIVEKDGITISLTKDEIAELYNRSQNISNILQHNNGVTRDIGEKLKLIRRSRGLKQSDLEKLTKIKREAISQYESGIRIPNDEAVFRLSKALDIDTSALSNVHIDTTDEFMHLLFELEDSLGMHISINNKEDENISLVFDNNKLKLENEILFTAFKKWYEAYTTLDKEDYEEWKLIYPLTEMDVNHPVL